DRTRASRGRQHPQRPARVRSGDARGSGREPRRAPRPRRHAADRPHHAQVGGRPGIEAPPAGVRAHQVRVDRPWQRGIRMKTLFEVILFLFLSETCFAQAPVVDATGREIKPPAKVERVYAAGPPASMLVFAIAPDKLLGWTRAFRTNEAEFVDPRYAALPELGRLTGRGNTANVEVILKAKADLIVDSGFTGEPF